VGIARTDVSEKPIASIIRVERLMMWAIRSSDASVRVQITRSCVPGDDSIRTGYKVNSAIVVYVILGFYGLVHECHSQKQQRIQNLLVEEERY
jgi:hypothetical protein